MICLINAPQWTTAMPPAALPSLAGFLERQNITCIQWDLNILFYNYILSAQFYKKNIKSNHHICYKTIDGKDVDFNTFLYDNIEKALVIIRDNERIVSKSELDWAYSIIRELLKVVSNYFENIFISLEGMNFDIEEDSITKIIDILEIKNFSKLLKIYNDIIEDDLLNEFIIIGFSVNNFSQLINSILITKLLRLKTNAHFILGGAFINAHLSEFINCNTLFEIFDSICAYDGENALASLYKKLRYNSSDTLNPNIILKSDYEMKSKIEYVIEDIRKLPSPIYNIDIWNQYLSPIRIISLPISRGCYGNCYFCSYNYCASFKWREKNIIQIVSEIKALKLEYNTKYFFFSVATLSPRMALELSERIIEENIDIVWASGIRIEKEFESKELVEKMAKSGCIRLDIGIESASQEVLDKMNKKTKSFRFVKIINLFNDFGINPYLYIIKNFPTETIQQWSDTINFLDVVKEKILGFSCYEYVLTPNTYVWENPDEFQIEYREKENFLDDSLFKVEYFKNSMEREEMEYKTRLLNRYYESNKNIFVRYGESFLKVGIPTSFQHQILFLADDSRKKYEKQIININYPIKLNPNVLIKDISDECINVFSLESLKSVIISQKLIEVFNCNGGIKLIKVLNDFKYFDKAKEKFLNQILKLLELGILCYEVLQ